MMKRLIEQADAVLDRRYEIVLLFDVQDGNPNGDPDADNMPRLDPETSHGLITDVCIKRKIRNFVWRAKGMEPPFDIFVKERGILSNEQRKAHLATGQHPGAEPNNVARDWMCHNYFDVRTFGAVMTTGKVSPKEGGAKQGKKTRYWNCGQVRGPVQVAFSRSVHPLAPATHAITRVALTNADDTIPEKKQEADAGEHGEEAATPQIGRKHTIPYGLYRCHIFVAPFLARDTKFKNSDFHLLLEALKNMFELDRSASRGTMSSQALYVFEHSSELGNAPSHKLFATIGIQPKTEVPRQFSDFDVTAPADGTEAMSGVTCWHML